jgi:hypothetical protein
MLTRDRRGHFKFFLLTHGNNTKNAGQHTVSKLVRREMALQLFSCATGVLECMMLALARLLIDGNDSHFVLSGNLNKKQLSGGAIDQEQEGDSLDWSDRIGCNGYSSGVWTVDGERAKGVGW